MGAIQRQKMLECEGFILCNSQRTAELLVREPWGRWLGLLLGTAMWYPFYDLLGADDATFEAKVEPIVRAIGDRGKVRTQGSAGFPHQAAVARAPATASEPSPEGAAAAPARAPVHAFATSSGNLSELAAILREQRDEAKAERLAMEAKMDRMLAAFEWGRADSVAELEKLRLA